MPHGTILCDLDLLNRDQFSSTMSRSGGFLGLKVSTKPNDWSVFFACILGLLSGLVLFGLSSEFRSCNSAQMSTSLIFSLG